MADQEEPPVPLPSAPLIELASNATLQPPLTRRGYGPGLIIITPAGLHADHKSRLRRTTPRKSEEGDSKPEEQPSPPPDTLDPLPQKKWAEEGYAVVEVKLAGLSEEEMGGWTIGMALGRAIEALVDLETCNVKDKFGLIVYGDESHYTPSFPSALEAAFTSEPRLAGSVTYSPSWTLPSRPSTTHLPGPPPLSPSSTSSTRKYHHYPSTPTPSSLFAHPSSSTYHHRSASVSHTRSLAFLRTVLGGPQFDLEAIWDEHTAYEFAARSVAATMGTMVDAPYVNHVPSLTGGVGRAALTAFYRGRFIFANPADAALELVSRTVGVDRVVDEFVFSLTHDRVVDWLLPGVPPTHKHLRIPFVAVVNIRGDRLYHEHIHWDQGTALAQAGLLPTYLPFPYALSDGRTAAPGKRFEYRVPAAGAEIAAKFEDAGAVASNGMFEYGIREVDM